MTVDQCATGLSPEVDFDDIEFLFNENAGAFIAQVRHMNELSTPAMIRLLSVSKKTYMEMEKGKRLATLQSMIDHCPRHIGRDADDSVCIQPSELAGVRPFFYDKDYYRMVAEGLLFYIREHQLTRRDLARYLNVTPRTVRRILSGEVSINFSYYARFYLSTGVYPLRILDDGPYLKIRLKLEQRLCLINDLIAGYASSPDLLDELLISLSHLPLGNGWCELFER